MLYHKKNYSHFTIIFFTFILHDILTAEIIISEANYYLFVYSLGSGKIFACEYFYGEHSQTTKGGSNYPLAGCLRSDSDPLEA